MASKLIEESTLMFSPTAARVIGLNEAIILQQVHYWATRTKRESNYIALHEWQRQLPFLSESTIKRAISNLRKKGLIIVEQHNRRRYDRTNWYRINYEVLERLMEPHKLKVNKGYAQDDQRGPVKMNGDEGQNDPVNEGQNEPTYTRDHTKNNTENTQHARGSLTDEDTQIIDQIIADRSRRGTLRSEDALRRHLEQEAVAGRLRTGNGDRRSEEYDFSDIV